MQGGGIRLDSRQLLIMAEIYCDMCLWAEVSQLDIYHHGNYILRSFIVTRVPETMVNLTSPISRGTKGIVEAISHG